MPQHRHGYEYRKRELKSSVYPLTNFIHKNASLLRFPSMREASRLTGVNQTSISACCVGTVKTAGGFIWSYAGEKWKPKKKRRALVTGGGDSMIMRSPTVPVIQLSLEGKFLKRYIINFFFSILTVNVRFASIKMASRKSGVGAECIGRVCRGGGKTAGGFLWEYVFG